MRFYGLCAIVLFLGCAESPTDSSAPEVRLNPEKQAYSANEIIRLRVSNISGGAASIFHCDNRVFIEIQRREGSGWSHFANFNGPACPAIYNFGALILGPGEERIETLSLQTQGEFRAVLTYGGGVFRIGYIAHSSPFVVH